MDRRLLIGDPLGVKFIRPETTAMRACATFAIVILCTCVASCKRAAAPREADEPIFVKTLPDGRRVEITKNEFPNDWAYTDVDPPSGALRGNTNALGRRYEHHVWLTAADGGGRRELGVLESVAYSTPEQQAFTLFDVAVSGEQVVVVFRAGTAICAEVSRCDSSRSRFATPNPVLAQGDSETLMLAGRMEGSLGDGDLTVIVTESKLGWTGDVRFRLRDSGKEYYWVKATNGTAGP